MPQLGKQAEKLSKELAELQGERDAQKIAQAVRDARLQDALGDIRRGMETLTRLLEPGASS